MAESDIIHKSARGVPELICRVGRNRMKGIIRKMSEIEVRNLSKTFTQKDLKVDALKDISISIEKGDI